MPKPHKRSAVFLDRDGVINDLLFHPEAGIIESPFTVGQFRLKPGVPEAIRKINRLGLLAVVISNQPGFTMGHFSLTVLARVTQKMRRDLGRRKAHLDGIYYCLHHPYKGKGRLRRRCRCRKPKPGLLYEAARDLDIDLRKSYLVGDGVFDVEAGRRAGCKTFLIAHLRCDLCNLMARRGIRPHYVVNDLKQAVTKIRDLEGK